MKKISLKIQQIMVRFLRKRKWIVFWLDEEHRECGGGVCWLKVYEQSEGRRK